MTVFDPANPQSWVSSGRTADYEEGKFYTRSTDRQGHSIQVRVNLPTEVGNHLNALVASRQVAGYKTTADVLRDALHHRLVWLEEDGQIGALGLENAHLLEFERIAQEIEHDKNRNAEAQKAIIDIEETLMNARRVSDDDQVTKTVMQGLEMMPTLRTFWATKLDVILAPYLDAIADE